MGEVENLIDLINRLKAWSVVGDVIVALVVGAAAIVTYIWQRRQIQSLKQYIGLWKPSESKEDLKSYLAMKDEINKATMDQYKDELRKSQNKEQEAVRIIIEMQQTISELQEKLLEHKPPQYEDLVPSGAKLTKVEEKDYVVWTMNFRSGLVKRFKFPVKPIRGNNDKEK